MKKITLAALAAFVAVPAFAEPQISIKDAYARSAGANAMTGAAFFTIVNTGDEDDRLIGASSDIAARVELHTHIEGENGVMQMREVEDGFPVVAGSEHDLMRGGDHVMFMGLTDGMEDGDTIEVTLTFEVSGDVVVEIPVDLMRKPGMSGQGQMNHNPMDHGAMKHDQH